MNFRHLKVLNSIWVGGKKVHGIIYLNKPDRLEKN